MSRENNRRFQNHLTELELHFSSIDDNDPDDPTLDLNNLDVVVRHECPVPNGNTTARDVSLDELKFLYNELKKRSPYANKLAAIMLEGVQKTLGYDIYKLFTKENLPPNWLPLVKINDKNTPYIEFLVKSDNSTDSLEGEFNNFTIQHFMYSSSIVKQICSDNSVPNPSPRTKTPSSKSSSLPQIYSPACKRPIHSTPTKSAPRRHSMPKRKASQTPLQPQKQPRTAQSTVQHTDHSYNRIPQAQTQTQSQPKHQQNKQPTQVPELQQQLVEQTSQRSILNCSVRIQPTRACRVKSP